MQVFDWKVYYFWILFLQNLIIRVLLHLLMELFSFLMDRLDHLNLWFYVFIKVLFSYILISILYFFRNQVSLTFWMETNYFLQIKDFIVGSYHFQFLKIDCFHQVLIVKKRSLNYLLCFGIFMIDMTPIQFIEDCLLLLPEEPYFVIIFNCHSFHYFN